MKNLVFFSFLFGLFVSCNSEIEVFIDDEEVTKSPLGQLNEVINRNKKLFYAIPGGREDLKSIPSAKINKIFEDESGNRYIATNNGLGIEYANGDDVLNITVNDGLASNVVNDVYVDGQNIFLATSAGLAISKNAGITFKNYDSSNGLGNDRIQNIYLDTNDKMYITTNNGIDLINSNGEVIRNISTTDGLVSNTINNLLFTPTHMFVATNSGLSISNDDGASFITKTTGNGLASNFIYDLDLYGTDLYLATNSGLNITSDYGESFVTKSTGDGLLNLNLLTVKVNDLGHIYTGSVGGISISMDGGTSFSDARIASFYVVDIQILNDGSLILSGNHDQTLVYENNSLSSYLEIDENFGGDITKIKSDGSGKLYFLTPNGYVTSDDDGDTFDTTYVNSFVGHNLRYMDIGSSGDEIYLGGDTGLFISLDGGGSFTLENKVSGLSANYVQGLDVDSSGNIYVLTYEFPALARLNISTDNGLNWTSRSSGNGIGHNNMTDVVINDVTGDIYVTSWGGIARSTDGGFTFTNRNTGNGLGHNQAYSVALDSSGNVYVGTYDGLSISTDFGNSFVNRTTVHGLAHDRVDLVRVDQDNIIYCENPYGSAFARSLDGGASFISYGLLTDNIHSSSITDVFKTSGAKVLFGSSQGLFWTDDNFSTYSSKQSRGLFSGTYITSIQFEGGKIYVGHSEGMSISEDNGKTFSKKTSLNSGLGSGSVRDIYVHNSDEVYVSTSLGASYSVNSGVLSFDPGVTFGGHNGISVDSANKLFIGTSFNGVDIGTVGSLSFTNITTADGLISNFTRDVYVDASDNLYVGTASGLSISYDSGASFINKTIADGLPSNGISVISGGVGKIYIGTSNGLAISSDNGASFVTRSSSDGLTSVSVTAIFEDGSDLYIGTVGGVFVSRDGGTTFNSFANKSTGLDTNIVYAIAKSPDGFIYIGTQGGLFRQR